jgi:Malectin domain
LGFYLCAASGGFEATFCLRLWEAERHIDRNPPNRMQTSKRLISRTFIAMIAGCALLALVGCETEDDHAPAKATVSATPAATTASTTPVTPAMAATPDAVTNPVLPPVRIKAGLDTSITDADGNKWLPDQGFDGGQTDERPDLQIVNTKSPDIYHSEHWSMDSFTYPVPNGKYTVKLHFCETYEGIQGPGDRVFSFNVQGKDFKDFDVWVKSGGFLHAYVETVPIEVTDGKVHITFTPKVENPEINGIEILPMN